MHRRIALILLAAPALTVLSAAASIDGKWVAQVEMPRGRKQQQSTETRPVEMTFDFKTEGNNLTGTMSGGLRRAGEAKIENGTIDGGKVAFTTSHSTKRGDFKTKWEGTIDGDQLKLKRSMEGARRSMEITAKRAG